MRVLTVRQPWASLIASTRPWAKTLENRGYRTSHRGPLAIHAAAAVRVSYSREQLAAIAAEGWAPAAELPTLDDLRLGAGKILALVELVDCRLASSIPAGEPWVIRHDPDAGEVETDAWCWVLDNVRVLREPIPHRGRQGGPQRVSTELAAKIRASCPRTARCPYCRNHPGQDIRDGMITDCPDCSGTARVLEGSRAWAEGVEAGLAAMRLRDAWLELPRRPRRGRRRDRDLALSKQAPGPAVRAAPPSTWGW